MRRTAILQVADTGPLESLVVMLRSVGYECALPSPDLRHKLRAIGCDTVLDIADLVRGMGYQQPMELPLAGVSDMRRSDVIYVDVKAHRNAEKVWRQWPNLIGKTLWYRINGGKPEIVPGCGDEVNPPCPVLTPNLWYREAEFNGEGRAYACWPPFHRFHQYGPRNPCNPYEPAICLIHNIAGWGGGLVINAARRLGVRCYGRGSPDGLVPHSLAKELLKSSLAMVHIKSSDAPGYALYEALATACPVVCSRRLPWRNRMEELYIEGVTCRMFDKPTHSAADVDHCAAEIASALEQLADPAENLRIGEQGRQRLLGLMWSEHKSADVGSLASFMQRHFD